MSLTLLMPMKEEKKVAVFDLNGTLYNKSSKDEFFKFICTKKPTSAIKYVHMGTYIILKKLHLVGQTEFKENFFRYLDGIDPVQVSEYAREFWKKEFPSEFNPSLLVRVKELKQQGIAVYIITGALELYVESLMEMYKDIDGFAGTRTTYRDKKHLVIGEACKGRVKLKMLQELMNGEPFKIVEAYSDSEEPILDEAQKAFLIKDGMVTPYS
ncbi:MAG: haloacid dehalogenase-like hydrolase [Bacteroidota bacterium]|nr:haloacid dehalogenase-like hydrolase [Bacteroidota bacterium]